MTHRALAAGLAAFLAAAAMGCAGPQSPPPKPAVVAPVQPAPPPAPEHTLDPREERRLVKDLLRDVAEYYRLLREKNVEQAATYVQPEQRRAFQDGLWEFVAKYRIESADVASYQLFPQADGVMAKVRVVRTLFERASVVPEKSEIWVTWRHLGDRWTLVPQQQK